MLLLVPPNILYTNKWATAKAIKWGRKQQNTSADCVCIVYKAHLYNTLEKIYIKKRKLSSLCSLVNYPIFIIILFVFLILLFTFSLSHFFFYFYFLTFLSSRHFPLCVMLCCINMMWETKLVQNNKTTKKKKMVWRFYEYLFVIFLFILFTYCS